MFRNGVEMLLCWTDFLNCLPFVCLNIFILWIERNAYNTQFRPSNVCGMRDFGLSNFKIHQEPI